MSSKVYPFGSVEVTIAASDKLALYSKGIAKVYQKVGYPNQPDSWDLFKSLAADEEYQSSAVSATTIFRIEAGASEVLYNYGAAAVIPELRSFGRVSAIALNATGNLTAAMIVAGLVTSTTAAAVTGTSPTGAVMDAAIRLNVNEFLDFTVVNTGAANAFTVAAGATGVTLVGSGEVAASSSGCFRMLKTAAATYVIYRLA